MLAQPAHFIVVTLFGMGVPSARADLHISVVHVDMRQSSGSQAKVVRKKT